MRNGQTLLRSLQADVHPYCLICSGSNPFGLALEFDVLADGSVTASFLGNPTLEGYPGWLHGGMIASLLDGVMTNCLFARGLVGVTADLNVRYRKPIEIGSEMLLRGWLERSRPPLYFMRAELHQENCLKASASAKFLQRNG